jgi:hypothetical protein
MDPLEIEARAQQLDADMGRNLSRFQAGEISRQENVRELERLIASEKDEAVLARYREVQKTR